MTKRKQDIPMQVTDASRALGGAGQADMVWGHVSLRDPAGRGVWMKAAGWGFGEVMPDRVVLVSEDGEVLEGTGRRHLEYPIHTRILAARQEAGAVVHSHSPAACVFASLDEPLRALSHDAVPFLIPDVPRFTDSGDLIRDIETGDALAAVLGEAAGALIPGHGLVTAGPDLATAVMYAVLLDRACRAMLDALAAGGPRRWSSEAEVAHKREALWTSDQLRAGYEHLVREAVPTDR